MNWTQNQWGGWRSDNGYAVAQTPKRWWRLWVPGRDMPVPEVYRRDSDAKAAAEAHAGGAAC